MSEGREEEILGGLRNAIDRGHSLEQAKKSFLNAGYTPQELELAINKLGISNNTFVTGENPSEPKPIKPNSSLQALPSSNIPKESSKKILIITLAILGFLVLAGAAVLGIFWDKIFT